MIDRRKFVKQTCLACLSGGWIASMLSGCRSTHYTTGSMETDGISLSKSEFMYLKKGQEMVRQYIMVRNDNLKFPIYLYRFSENEYSALWMKCTHQGAELQASGDHLHCPSHGSEFNNKGVVRQGPAEENLRSFPVSVMDDKIIIDMRQS